MKCFLYFTFYRLHQWSEKREPTIPMIMVLAWLTVISFFHVCTVLSLITIIWGVDAGYIFNLSTSRMVIATWMTVWALLLWAALKFGRVKEKAFSPIMLNRYKEKGFKDWWVWMYFAVSFVAMGLSTWFAGSRLMAQGTAG